MEHSQNNVLHFYLGPFWYRLGPRRDSSPSPLFYRGLPSFLSGSSGHHLCKYCPRLCNAASHRLLFGPCIPSLFGPLGVFLCGFSLSAMAFYPELLVHPLFSHAERIGQQPFPSRSSSSCKRHFRRPKGKAMGIFLSGQCRLCRRSRGSRVQRLSVWHQGAHHLRRSQFSYGSLSDEETSCNQKKTQRDRKRECHSNEPQPKNDWNAFGKLSFVIFARSIGFTILNSFIPIYWISVLGTSASSGSLALSPAFSMGVVMTFFGRYPGRQSGTHQGHADILPRHGPRPLLSHKQYQPNDSNPALGADGSFPFCALQSHGHLGTDLPCPQHWFCFRRDLGSQCQCRRPDFSPGRMGCRPLGCWS